VSSFTSCVLSSFRRKAGPIVLATVHCRDGDPCGNQFSITHILSSQDDYNSLFARCMVPSRVNVLPIQGISRSVSRATLSPPPYGIRQRSTQGLLRSQRRFTKFVRPLNPSTSLFQSYPVLDLYSCSVHDPPQHVLCNISECRCDAAFPVLCNYVGLTYDSRYGMISDVRETCPSTRLWLRKPSSVTQAVPGTCLFHRSSVTMQDLHETGYEGRGINHSSATRY